MAAARTADATVLRALLQKGADVNAAEADGTTALHWASYRDDGDSADVLIRAGAKVNAANDLGATPLWTASLNGSEAMVRRLLAAGANPNAALLAGETPVMVASRAGKPAVVEQLIAKGANVNAHGARGQTALMWAVSQKHPDVVKVLLAHGADIHARSDTWSQVMAVEPHGYLPVQQDRSRPGARPRCCLPRASAISPPRGCWWLPAPTSTMPMPGASAPRRWPRTRATGS